MSCSKINIGTLRSDIQLLNEQENMLFDPASDTYYKVSGNVLKIMAFMTENMSLEDFLLKLEKNGVAATKENILELLSFLKKNNLLVPEYGETSSKRTALKSAKEKTSLLRISSSYLFFRLPPWRPENLFKRITPYVSFAASKKMLITMMIPAIIGYLFVIRDFSLVKSTFINTMSWAGLVKYFAAIIILKIIHEAAHSIAAMHFNCRVRGIGIGFMLFYPRLYTDTTDSWKLPRRERILIDAAGIIAELLIGGLAALIWHYLAPGTLKSTMFYIFAVSTLSSLLVNGNPLIRYDGYYILCDLLKTENLMGRASDFIKQYWRWLFLRLGDKPVSENSFVLVLFGVSSFIYRLFLYTSIILVIYNKFAKLPAVIMIFLELYTIFIYPCWKEVQIIRKLSKKSAGRAGYLLSFAILSAVVAVLFLPLSWSSVLPGESSYSNRQQIVTTESGYLDKSLLQQSKKISVNECILKLNSPLLDFSIAKLESITKHDKILYSIQQLDEMRFPESVVTKGKIDSDLVALEELKRRKEKLHINADTNGVFVLRNYPVHRGAFISKGTIVGDILSGNIIINAYADEREIGKLSPGSKAVVYTRDSLKKYKAEITGINTIPVTLNESPVLQSNGGVIPVYFDENKKCFSADRTLYRVTLELKEKCDLSTGRFVTVKVSNTGQLYKPLFRFIISAFRKEF